MNAGSDVYDFDLPAPVRVPPDLLLMPAKPEITEPGPGAESRGRPGAPIQKPVGLACWHLSVLPFSAPPGHPLCASWMRQRIRSCWAPGNTEIVGSRHLDLCCCHWSSAPPPAQPAWSRLVGCQGPGIVCKVRGRGAPEHPLSHAGY